MRISITRTSPTHHRFAHFRVESEAGLDCGFFGLLARRADYGGLALARGESGAMTVVTRDNDVEPKSVIAGLENLCRA